MKLNGLEPIIVKSEEEAKSYEIKEHSTKYPIFFFNTDTSGEKTYEEFYSKDEDYEINLYDSLGYIKSKEKIISFSDILIDFKKVFDNPNSSKNDIIQVIKKYVPDFNHIEKGKHLDQKM